MAERRIFSIKVTESDAFFALPANAQALYLHLNMLADDDGFINNGQSAVSRIQGGKAALKALIEKRFILQFGMILVVKHWRIANSLKSDRTKPLSYPDIAKCIWLKQNRSYTDHQVHGCKTLFEMRTGIRPESIRNPSGIQPESQQNGTEQNGTELNRTEQNPAGGASWLSRIWKEYPEDRRGSQADFREACGAYFWDDDTGVEAYENLILWKQSDQWAKDGGRYIPYLANWIARGTWATKPTKMAVPTGGSGRLGEAELEAIQQVLAQPDEPFEE